MFGIRTTFKHLFGRAAAAAFNQVVSYLDNFCADESIDFHRPDSPTAENPPCIGVNKSWLSAVIAEAGAGLDGVGANKIVGTNASSKAAAVADIPTTSNANWNKVLGIAAGGTAVSFAAATLVAENPGNALTGIAWGGTVSARTFSTSSTNGYRIPVLTHISWDGTDLKCRYSLLTFDKYGRLYSIGAGQTVTIDTPTKVTWS